MNLLSDEEHHPSTRAIPQLPELTRCWIAFAPRRWKAYDGWWTDLSSGILQRELSQRSAASHFVPRIGGDLHELDDLFYLPPVDEDLRVERDLLAAGLAEGGTPVLIHRLPGEPREVEEVSTVVDLTPLLIEGELERLATIDPEAYALWPLIPGLSDHSDIWEEGLAELVRAGVKVVLPVVVEIAPRLRRLLAQGREDHVFDALFHSEPPAERSFSLLAHELGLETLPERPITGFSARQRSNRWLAGKLALAAELWLRLGRSVVAGQALLRAARGADHSPQDLVALARERNLRVLEWLDARSTKVIEDLVGHDRSLLVEKLRAEYLGDVVASRSEDDGEGSASSEPTDRDAAGDDELDD